MEVGSSRSKLAKKYKFLRFWTAAEGGAVGQFQLRESEKTQEENNGLKKIPTWLALDQSPTTPPISWLLAVWIFADSVF